MGEFYSCTKGSHSDMNRAATRRRRAEQPSVEGGLFFLLSAAMELNDSSSQDLSAKRNKVIDAQSQERAQHATQALEAFIPTTQEIEAVRGSPLLRAYQDKLRQPSDAPVPREDVIQFFSSCGIFFDPSKSGVEGAHMSVDLLYAFYCWYSRERSVFAAKKQFSRYLKKYMTAKYPSFPQHQVLKWQVTISKTHRIGLPAVANTSVGEVHSVLWRARDSRDRVFLLRGTMLPAHITIPREALLLFYATKLLN